MATMRISRWVSVAGLALVGCGGETRVAPENEACLGPSPAGAVDYTAAGMPSAEPDLQAWVTVEQHGMTRVTTRPCEPSPPTRMLLILPEAPVAFHDGEKGTFADIDPGQKLSVWHAGGAKGKARAVFIERTVPWPPGSAPAAPEAPAPPAAPAAEGAATTDAPDDAPADTGADTAPPSG
jgi:hypothetical protein